MHDHRDVMYHGSFNKMVYEICALLGCYATHGGNSLPTLQYNLSVPSSRVKKSKKRHYCIMGCVPHSSLC